MDKDLLKQYIPQGTSADFYGNSGTFEVASADLKALALDLRDNRHFSLKMITATDERKENGCFKIWYVFGIPQKNVFIIPFITLKNSEKFPSLYPFFHEAIDYERKIRTFFGLTPVGNPDPRPIILHENWPENIFPLRKDVDWQVQPPEAKGKYQFHRVSGEGIYEIPVGPIHAGIIEPGHFRFSVAGESIVFLEPRLGFVHKGIEKLFERLSCGEAVRLSEKISGDSSFSHSLAFCEAVERLGSIEVPLRARYLRVIYAELERLANHFGDIGAIMLDTGFNFGGAHGARLKEMIMQLNESLTGSRFLRMVNTIGGVTKDITAKDAKRISGLMAKIDKDFSEVVEIAENSSSLINRLKGTGVLSNEIARHFGVVGVAARSSGISTDVRAEFPYAAYGELSFNGAEVETSGDVYARFRMRVKEVSASIQMIRQALSKLSSCGKDIAASYDGLKLKKNACAVSAVEGWRGEIVYFISTDAKGAINRVAPRDPSFLNWAVLGKAGLDNVVPDFPLINKSFNLSYSGNDL